MPCETVIKVGEISIRVTAKNEEDLFRDASLWGELPTCCGLCQSKSIALHHRETSDYQFFELKCKSCGATYALGQKKEGGLYPRGNKDTGLWEEKYEKKNSRDDDRRDDRRDSRRDDRRDDRRNDDRRGGREDDRRDQQRDQRGKDDRRPPQAGKGAQHPDDEDDIPFNDRTGKNP